MGVETESPPGNGPYSFRQSVLADLSLFQIRQANKPGLFSILLKQQPNRLETNQTKGVWSK
jgi:hypothetical protein